MITTAQVKQTIEAITAGQPQHKSIGAALTLALLSRQPVEIVGNPGNGFNKILERLNALISKPAKPKQKIPLAEKDSSVISISQNAVIRIECQPTTDEQQWLDLINNPALPPLQTKFKIDEAGIDAALKKVAGITISSEAQTILLNLKRSLRATGYEPSDEYWQQVVYVLKVAAIYNNRKSVDASDCLLLQYMILGSYKAGYMPPQQEIKQAIINLCTNTDGAMLNAFDFTSEQNMLLKIQQLKAKIQQLSAVVPPAPIVTQTQPVAQEQPEPAVDPRMLFVPMVGGHFFVEGLDLLVRENDIKTLSTTDFRELRLYQQQRTGEFTDAGAFMVRMFGNCRLEFKDKPLRTSSSSLLKIKTHDGVPVLDPGQTYSQPVPVQPVVMPPAPVADNSLALAGAQAEYNSLKNALYGALITKRDVVAKIQPRAPMVNVFLPQTDTQGIFTERLQQAHNTIKQIETDLSNT